jgi:hypothetical protein
MPFFSAVLASTGGLDNIMWCGFNLICICFSNQAYFGSNACSLFVGPGDYVARDGEPVDGLYIILDGQVKSIVLFLYGFITYGM